MTGARHMSWLSLDDYALVDEEWFHQRAYRTKKSLNDIVVDDACSSLLRIVYVSRKGLSVKLMRTLECKKQWHRDHPLYIQLAPHSHVHPVTFSSRCIKR